jgi:hypothetical protein
MTVVVGADYGSEILVLSDTRVSFGDPDTPPPRNGLIKVVTIDFFGRKAVLGFSGCIPVVRAIINSLKTRAKDFQSSGSLKADVQNWIKEAVNRDWIRAWIRDSAKQEKRDPLLQFLLCDLDPSDETHVHLYGVGKTREVQYTPAETITTLVGGSHPARGTVAAIGYGREFTQVICDAALWPVGRPSNYRDHEAYLRVRAGMAEKILSSYFQSKDLKEVGGPFVITLVRPDGIVGPHPMWPPFAGASDVQTSRERSRLVLFRPSTGEKHVLYSVLDYTEADFSQHSDAAASIDSPHYVI